MAALPEPSPNVDRCLKLEPSHVGTHLRFIPWSNQTALKLADTQRQSETQAKKHPFRLCQILTPGGMLTNEHHALLVAVTATEDTSWDCPQISSFTY